MLAAVADPFTIVDETWSRAIRTIRAQCGRSGRSRSDSGRSRRAEPSSVQSALGSPIPGVVPTAVVEDLASERAEPYTCGGARTRQQFTRRQRQSRTRTTQTDHCTCERLVRHVSTESSLERECTWT